MFQFRVRVATGVAVRVIIENSAIGLRKTLAQVAALIIHAMYVVDASNSMNENDTHHHATYNQSIAQHSTHLCTIVVVLGY
jgi:hypothetical protein